MKHKKGLGYEAQAISIARADRSVRHIIGSRYNGHSIHWDTASVGGDASEFVWVNVLGESREGALHLRALIDLPKREVLLTQHTTVVGDESGARVTIRLDEEEPVWAGRVENTNTVIPDEGSMEVPNSQVELAEAGWCTDIMSRVCKYAMAGNFIIACAIFATTGFDCHRLRRSTMDDQ